MKSSGFKHKESKRSLPFFVEKNSDQASTVIDTMFRAFSDQTRLRILNLIQEQEICVGDLVLILDIPQSTASRHLAYLRKAQLVDTRKNGFWCFYSLAKAKNQFHRCLLDCLGCCFQEVPELAADLKKAKTLWKRGGGCCPPGQTKGKDVKYKGENTND